MLREVGPDAVGEAGGVLKPEGQREATDAKGESRDRHEGEEQRRDRAVEAERTSREVGGARVGDARRAEAEGGPEQARAEGAPPTAPVRRNAPQRFHCARRRLAAEGEPVERPGRP